MNALNGVRNLSNTRQTGPAGRFFSRAISRARVSTFSMDCVFGRFAFAISFLSVSVLKGAVVHKVRWKVLFLGYP